MEQPTMIQDIYPHKLDNHYDPAKKPDADSIILYFTKDGLLHRLLKKSDLEGYRALIEKLGIRK